MQPKVPEYIYHYTTIETLALILKNRNIRFSSIGGLDDLTEAISNVGAIYSYALVSCWTDQAEENIALWNMYCKGGNGVRIRMRPTLFHNDIGVKSDNLFMIEHLNIFYLVNFLFKIEYTDHPNRNIRGSKTDADGKQFHTIDFTKVGKQKHLVWKFQSEWRFIIYQFPDKESAQAILKFDILNKSVLSEKSFKCEYYDFDIQNDEMKNMQIMMGPTTTESEKIIIQSIVEKYNPMATIIESGLKGKIKSKKNWL